MIVASKGEPGGRRFWTWNKGRLMVGRGPEMELTTTSPASGKACLLLGTTEVHAYLLHLIVVTLLK